MNKAYEHQQKIITEDKKKCGIFTGTGSGKTFVALNLAEGNTLVICPKQQKLDKTWQRNAEKFNIKIDLTVISKEDLRKSWRDLPAFTTVIIDECHNNLGVQPCYVQRKKIQYPKSSQIFEATQNFLKKYPPKRLYLLSATPVPKPMSLWAIGILFGQDWDFAKFRDIYYTEVRMGLRRIWIPKRGDAIRQRMADLIQKLGYTGSLNDFFDVPEQTHKVVEIELSNEQKHAINELMFAEADPLVRRARLRTIENGVLYGKKVDTIDGKTDQMSDKTTIYKSGKIDYILERALEFPKLLIFANYTAQIHEIERALKKEGYNVSTLTGQTKDRTFIKKVNESSEPHIIIAQSSISSGYELPSFPCVIYASKSWRYVDYEQSLGRVLRANHLKKNLYIHLIVEGCDKDCHDTIMSGQDFQEKLTLNI
jgi:superfamily II DNA or RNA helicase